MPICLLRGRRIGLNNTPTLAALGWGTRGTHQFGISYSESRAQLVVQRLDILRYCQAKEVREFNQRCMQEQPRTKECVKAVRWSPFKAKVERRRKVVSGTKS